MSGEHGDGLARSVWNAKLFGPEVYAASRPSSARSTPTNRLNPGKVVAAPDPGDNLRIGPDYHPVEPARPSSTSPARAGSPAPSRCARASAPAARRAPGRCARATWSPATRSTRPAAAPTRCGW